MNDAQTGSTVVIVAGLLSLAPMLHSGWDASRISAQILMVFSAFLVIGGVVGFLRGRNMPPDSLCKDVSYGIDVGCWERSNTPGNWVFRYPGGDAEEEGPFLNGERHGHWVLRYFDDGVACVAEGPYVKGKRHGHWIFRPSSGAENKGWEEGSYVNGKKHGRWVTQYPDGHVFECLYLNGERHGRWVERFANGREQISVWENGKLKDYKVKFNQ